MKKSYLYLTLVVTLMIIISCGGNSRKTVAEDTTQDIESNETENDSKNNHEWVDLGLPSGTKWATMNLGATSPADCGDYFAWGELAPKERYSENGYKFPIEDDETEELPSSKDAAVAYWGEDWRMPSETEFKELLEECDCEYETQDNGVVAFIAVGPNGKSIMLPLAGWKKGAEPIEKNEEAKYHTRTRTQAVGAFTPNGPRVFKASIGRTNYYDNGESGYHAESIATHFEEITGMEPHYGLSIRAVYVGK